MDFDDDGTQRPLEVPDYDLEVDFSELDEEEKEVSRRPSECVVARVWSLTLDSVISRGRW